MNKVVEEKHLNKKEADKKRKVSEDHEDQERDYVEKAFAALND